MLALSTAQLIYLADRRHGIGCDQVIIMEQSDNASASADLSMRIINADGSEVAACGNATRCVAWLLDKEQGKKHRKQQYRIQTQAGILTAMVDGEQVTVNMGTPLLDWQDIPLAEAHDTLHVPIGADILADACCVNIGNPHAVFFVSDVLAVDLETLGPIVEMHAIFPERVNVSIASVEAENSIQLRVWERGVGLTAACGTAACATLIAAVRRQAINGKEASIHLPGGILHIQWQDDGVYMRGTVNHVFEGIIAL